jgi:CMP-N-acetylneuraminic acid synthetase
MKKIYAFIPARIGSVRIIKKNIMQFNNRPLIHWTVEAAIKSKIFSKIFVSSDSKEIYEKLNKFNIFITILYRTKSLSKSNSKIDTLLKYYIKKKYFCKNSIIVLLQPTSPLRNSKIIKKTLKFFVKNKLKSLITVSNIKNKFAIKEYKKVLNIQNPKSKVFFNGAIYINTLENIKKYKKINNKKSFFYMMENHDSLDIDDLNDINKFKKKFRLNLKT